MSKQEKNSDQLLSVKDLTRYFAVSRQSIFRWIATGELKPTLKMGHVIRFTPEAVEEFIRANEAQRNTQNA
jgi:excisionase family DNA binding protein